MESENRVSGEELLYRGIREDFIDNGILHPRTFGRKPRAGDEVPEIGVSLQIAAGFGFVPKAACDALRQAVQQRYEKTLRTKPNAKPLKQYVGIISILAQRIYELEEDDKNLGLIVIQDKVNHALLMNLPVLDYDKHDPEALKNVVHAERLSNLLIRQCKKEYEFGVNFSLYPRAINPSPSLPDTSGAAPPQTEQP